MDAIKTNEYIQAGLKANNCSFVNEWLTWLANEYEIPYSEVRGLAQWVGPNEMFDGLVSEVKSRSEQIWG